MCRYSEPADIAKVLFLVREYAQQLVRSRFANLERRSLETTTSRIYKSMAPAADDAESHSHRECPISRSMCDASWPSA